MQKFALVLLPLIFVNAAFAQEGEWRMVNPDECSFSVKMPTDPETKSETTDYQGRKIHSFIYDAYTETTMYSVNCSDYPIARMLDSKEKVLAMLKESAKARVKGEPAELKEIELKGYSGIAYVEKIGNAVIYHRVYVVEEKLYQLDVGDLSGDGQAGAQKFFQSFNIE